MTAIELTAADESKIEEFAGSLFSACLATMELANVELGIRLGLYEALVGAGPVTAAELARRAGIGATRASGSSSRRWQASSRSTIRHEPRRSASSCCPTRMRTSCSTTTARRA